MPELSHPGAAPFQELLLDIAQERSIDRLLGRLVERLETCPSVALARVWLEGPGDLCDGCHLQAECDDRTKCLHLVASSGHSIVDPETEWSGIEGRFQRFPIGVRKVGRIAATGQALEATVVNGESDWLADPEWARAEGIRGFVGEPLTEQGELMRPIGVLGVFLREEPDEERISWLRMVAAHASTAIANARAFEENERLRAQLQVENEFLKEEVSESAPFGEIVGKSHATLATSRKIELVAPTDASVLILGESGTGKELVAREIHARSQRSAKRMVRVNCASIPRDLYESEFFGHAKGAFTGALRERAGRFELADGGTLFLDEVGEIPLELQGKLLRVLQEGQYERVGEERTRQVDVRVIAATNRDLKEEVAARRFREDLFYRLNVFPIEIAPLRERKEDIPPLATHFLNISAAKLNCNTPGLTRANLRDLSAYDWPGNVRELENVIERAVITSSCGPLRIDLPTTGAGGAAGGLQALDAGGSAGPVGEVLTEQAIRELEQKNTLEALERSDWRVYGPDGAAELLKIKPTTLSSRVAKWGLTRSS